MTVDERERDLLFQSELFKIHPIVKNAVGYTLRVFNVDSDEHEDLYQVGLAAVCAAYRTGRMNRGMEYAYVKTTARNAMAQKALADQRTRASETNFFWETHYEQRAATDPETLYIEKEDLAERVKRLADRRHHAENIRRRLRGRTKEVFDLKRGRSIEFLTMLRNTVGSDRPRNGHAVKVANQIAFFLGMDKQAVRLALAEINRNHRRCVVEGLA